MKFYTFITLISTILFSHHHASQTTENQNNIENIAATFITQHANTPHDQFIIALKATCKQIDTHDHKAFISLLRHYLEVKIEEAKTPSRAKKIIFTTLCGLISLWSYAHTCTSQDFEKIKLLEQAILKDEKRLQRGKELIKRAEIEPVSYQEKQRLTQAFNCTENQLFFNQVHLSLLPSKNHHYFFTILMITSGLIGLGSLGYAYFYCKQKEAADISNYKNNLIHLLKLE